MEQLTRITIWFSIANGGDGSAYPRWFLTEEAAEDDQASDDEGWGESCTGSIETFEGSDVHEEAVSGEAEYKDKSARTDEDEEDEDY